MTRAEERAVRSAWTKFDRLTAYGCRQRGRDYDAATCRNAWEAYQAVAGVTFPSPFTGRP